MGKTVKTPVLESLDFLKKLKNKQKTLKGQKRIACLLLLKNEEFKTQQELANYLGIQRRTLSTWLNLYRNKGIKGLELKITRKKKSKIITSEIHQGLLKKVNDSNNPLLGYWDAQRWVMDNFNVSVQYHWLRVYMIKHFKTKLKSPRKSHYKKDQQAVNAFLKTP